jgi:hypothetical protein
VEYFTENNKISIAITVAEGAAAATALEGAVLDTAGFEGGCAIVAFGPIVTGAATSIKLQQCDTSGGSYADVVGTSQTVTDADDNKVFYIDFKRTNERYVKVYVSRATQAATCVAVYVQYGARRRPVTQGTNVAGEQFTAAIEGTA